MKKVKLFLLAAITSIFFIGCEKDKIDKPEEMVIQSFTLPFNEGVINKEFNPDTWIWPYDVNQYVLTLTGNDNSNTYTKSVSLTELQNGVNINMMVGNYNILWETSHLWISGDLSPLSTDIDLKINQNVDVVGTPTTLTATIEDLAIIVDIPGVEWAGLKYSGNAPSLGAQHYYPKQLQLNTEQNVLYGYISGNELMVNGWYGDALWLVFVKDGELKTFNLSTHTNGNYYHYTGPFGNTINIEGLNMNEVQIIVE